MDKSGTADEFKDKLTPEQYRVLREKGTEAPFSGQHVAEKRTGSYNCAACGAVLFASDTKFDSGSGWPSFTEPANKANVVLNVDTSLGMRRTEVKCKNFGSHLGHVFDDGPLTLPNGAAGTGERYCINSVALDFQAKTD